MTTTAAATRRRRRRWPNAEAAERCATTRWSFSQVSIGVALLGKAAMEREQRGDAEAPTALAGDVPMRSAEKARRSTCVFADVVAREALAAFEQRCPPELREQFSEQQTVVAALVAQWGERLEVVSVAAGTKVLPIDALREHRLQSDALRSGDGVVRDMHAEVLARRGLVRHLLELVAAAQPLLDASAAAGRKRPRARRTSTTAPTTRSAAAPLGPALARRGGGAAPVHLLGALRQRLSQTVRAEAAAAAGRERRVRRRRRAAAVARARAPGAGPQAPPVDGDWQQHDAVQFTHVAHGQVALQAKVNCGAATGAATGAETDAETGAETDVVADVVAGVEAGAESQGQAAGGGPLAPVAQRRGSSLSCSDKLLQWNVLGLQGALLGSLLAPATDAAARGARAAAAAQRRRRPQVQRAPRDARALLPRGALPQPLRGDGDAPGAAVHRGEAERRRRRRRSRRRLRRAARLRRVGRRRLRRARRAHGPRRRRRRVARQQPRAGGAAAASGAEEAAAEEAGDERYVDWKRRLSAAAAGDAPAAFDFCATKRALRDSLRHVFVAQTAPSAPQESLWPRYKLS
eukprot:gene11017-7839_t